jgi:hypothetical protein
VIVFKGGARSSKGARTGLGKSFGGLVAYLERGPREHPDLDRVAWSATRNLDTDNPAEAAQVMRYSASDNPRVEKPVYHFGLSLQEGEHLTREQWEEIGGRVLTRMGLADHQAILIAHHDTDKEHIHIVVNRIGEDGRAWRPYRDMVAAREEVRSVERDYGLGLTGREQAPPDLSAGSVREAMRTGVQPLADRVREEAGPVFAQATGWRDLEAGLAELGYRLQPAARGAGLVVTDGIRRASLSHVDRNLSGPKLAARYGETFREYRARHPEPPTVQRVSGREVEPLTGKTLHQRAEALLERVTATRATFTKADIERAAFHEPRSLALTQRALDSPNLVEVGKDTRGVVRYASRDYLRQEERLFSAAAELASRRGLALDPAAVGRVLDRAPHLSEEQRVAVLAATTGGDLAQIVGRAGAGKTTAASAIAEAYREAGYEVRGAALAGKAAETLQQETGIRSRTLHSWEDAWVRKGVERLHAGSVLVIDEAGMVDARQLGRMLDYAQQSNAKVILLGDPDQLKPIGPGDAFRGLLEQHSSAHLETIRRQAEPWQREASTHLAGGRVATALDAYEKAGRLHVAETRATARGELLARYVADRAAAPAGGQLVLAYRNDDVRQLNAEIRAARQAAGELGPGVAVSGADYAAGDRVVFLRNDHPGREVGNLERGGSAVGVKNGTLATLESVAPDRFVGRLDDGRRVAWNPEQYDRIAHGYAVTVHKSQGATVDRTYVLADPMMNRNASYVALTRHRQGVEVYTDRATFATREHLDCALSRAPGKDLARDYAVAALGRNAARIVPLQKRQAELHEAIQEIGAARRILETAADEERRLARARSSLDAAAARVYADPGQAIDRLLSSTGPAPAEAYGELHGRGGGRFRRPDAARQAAEQAIPELRAELRSYRTAASIAAQARERAARTGLDPQQLEIRTHKLNQALRRVEQAMKAPTKALEAVVRDVGTRAARHALSVLPRAFELSISLAMRAVERVLDRDRGYELSR